MNERQKVALLAGVGVFFAMLIYCPWEEMAPSRSTSTAWGGFTWENRTVYDWCWPSMHRDVSRVGWRERDTDRLRWQIMAWALVVMLAFLRLRTRPATPG